jgi:hypothetical protein
VYVYRQFEPGLWTVGHDDPAGKWHPESDHDDRESAAAWVHYLNGGRPPIAGLTVERIGPEIFPPELLDSLGLDDADAAGDANRRELTNALWEIQLVSHQLEHLAVELKRHDVRLARGLAGVRAALARLGIEETRP